MSAGDLQVHWSNALLLHAPEDVAIDMSRWRGHFGTLMPFYAACERAGGFTGKTQRLLPPVDAPLERLPGAEAAVPEAAGERLGVELADLRMYAPPRRKDGSVADWGAPIRCAAGGPALWVERPLSASNHAHTDSCMLELCTAVVSSNSAKA